MVESRVPLQLTEKPMKLLAVIPARGNSTRVPGKNKMRFGGVSCVVRTIEAVRECTYSPTIAVVSNDPEIRMLAAIHGALALQEPPAVAKGDLYDVLYFALKKVEGPWEAILLAYPNVPIRPPEIFSKIVDVLIGSDLQWVSAVCLDRNWGGSSVYCCIYLDKIFADRNAVNRALGRQLNYRQDQLVEIDSFEDVAWANTLMNAGAV